MGNGRVTLVKRAYVSPAAAAEEAQEINLGLSINEMARILGVQMSCSSTGALVAATPGRCQSVISFDPDDIITANNDDEQFCYMDVAYTTIAATVGAVKTSEAQYFDYSNLNLLTTRNVALIGAATGAAYTVQCSIFYEKYKPSTAELTEMIAHRR